MKEKIKRQKINIIEFALMLVESKILTDYFNKLINRIKNLAGENFDEKKRYKYILEYLVFDLFTDHACFILALGPEKASKLFEIYSLNIVPRFNKIKWEEFEKLYKKRFLEYHKHLQEYDPEYIKKTDINKYLPGLGMAFSINFIGYKNPFLAEKAQWEFLLKLKHLYKNFSKDLMDKYEIV